MAKAKDEDTPKSAAMFTVEDIWINAIARFPDTKPLANLLRAYSTPMPDGIRDSLAELLSPGDPDICGGRLVYEPNQTFRLLTGSEVDGDAGLLSLAEDFHVDVDRRKWRGEKDPSKKAAASVGKKTGRGKWRTVYRKLEILRAIAARLRGR